MKVTAGVNDLATINPTLATQWHPTRNGNITAKQISPGSNFEVWWICSEDHEWQATPVSRIPSRDRGCFMCLGKMEQDQTGGPVVQRRDFVSLLTSHPKIGSEWHPTKNGNLLVRRVTEKHSAAVWWLCSDEHVWKTTIDSRINGDNQECPRCLNRKRLAEFLITINPRFIAECHPTKNDNLPFYQFSINAITWLCAEGHDWAATVNSRVKGKTCPICSGEKILIGVTDLLTIKPLLSLEWHPTKNGNRELENVSINSKIKASWICPEGHEWNANPAALSSNEGSTGCPICSNRARLSAEWHPTRNGTLTVEDIIPQSMTRRWWLCSEGHEWNCHFGKRILEGNKLEECPTCSSLSSIHTEWHPTKNDKQIPEDAILEPRIKFWWLCSEGHEWKASAHERTRRGSFDRCPFCSNHRKVIVGKNDFLTTHPEVAEEWHPTKNINLTPEYITAGLNHKYWWLSSLCSHEWGAFISNRSKGSKCVVCSGRALYRPPTLIGQTLFTINPVVSLEWHSTKNGKLTPAKVAAGSSKKVWWACSKGHEWEATVHSRNKGSGCASCWAVTYTSKAEKEIYEYIVSLDKDILILTSDRTVLKGKELDIYLPERKIAIEFNGVYWHSEVFGNKSKYYHYNKWLACRKKGIRLIQVWEDDWNRNSNIVKHMVDYVLKPSKQEYLQLAPTVVRAVNELQAQQFSDMYHIEGFATGSQYLGLVEEHDLDTIQAILVLENNPINTENKTGNIVRYAAKTNTIGNLDKLLTYCIDAYDLESFLAISDNCGIDGEIYEALGFEDEKVLPPDYMYAVINKRYSKVEYSLKRFQEDEKLEFDEDFTAEELAYLNDIARIWDAGKTLYRLSL